MQHIQFMVLVLAIPNLKFLFVGQWWWKIVEFRRTEAGG